MELRLTVEGASELEIQRGLTAAVSVFEKSGTSPLRAADGYWELEGWDDRGFLPEEGISDEDDAAASVWIDAEMAAIEAANRDRPKEQHLNGALELILTPEEKEQYLAGTDEMGGEEEERQEQAILAALKEQGYPPPPPDLPKFYRKD